MEAPNGDTYIKRVIGVAGDSIAFENDVLYVNGDIVDEPYVHAYKEKVQNGLPFTADFTLQSVAGVETIPEGYIFVLGDNRRNSTDSRDPDVGLVPIDKVLGKTSIRIFPFNEIGIVD